MDDEKPRISVALSASVLERLDKYAGEHRWSRSTAAAVLIERALSGEQGSQADDP
jgi:hypothetical protein